MKRIRKSAAEPTRKKKDVDGVRRCLALFREKTDAWIRDLDVVLRDPVNVPNVELIMERRGEIMLLRNLLAELSKMAGIR